MPLSAQSAPAAEVDGASSPSGPVPIPSRGHRRLKGQRRGLPHWLLLIAVGWLVLYPLGWLFAPMLGAGAGGRIASVFTSPLTYKMVGDTLLLGAGVTIFSQPYSEPRSAG